MAEKLIAKIDRTVDRVGYWGGTWKLLYDNWQTIALVATTVGGTLFAAAWNAWRYIQMIAANVSFWFYPFFFAVFIFAVLGLLAFSLLSVRFIRGETALGAPRSKSQDSEITEIEIQKLRSLEAENNSIRQKLNDAVSELNYTRDNLKLVSRIEQLSQDFERSKKIAEEHESKAKEMMETVATAHFTDQTMDPYTPWYYQIVLSNGHMEGLRDQASEIIKRSFGKDFDFMKTPQLDDNPYSITPPNIDRLPLDKFKFDYKKFYERLTRAKPVISGLPSQLEAELKREKQRLIDAGKDD